MGFYPITIDFQELNNIDPQKFANSATKIKFHDIFWTNNDISFNFESVKP